MTNIDTILKSRLSSSETDDDYEYVELSYLDWPAIFAGAAVAAAISTLLTTFGAGVGLSLISPFSGKGLSATATGIAIALWILWIAVSSFAVGGYITGRMRRRIYDVSAHESDVRDGAHGLIVWAIGALLLTYVAGASISGLTKSVTQTTAAAATVMAPSANPLTYMTERLLRSTKANDGNADSSKSDSTMQILAQSTLSGAISPDDKAYLSGQIAARTGITAQEATKRVDDMSAEIAANMAKAKQEADYARKIGILITFLTAASLAIAAAAAWWAASMGGKHRDESVDLSHLTIWR